jgi:hypothetical protein
MENVGVIYAYIIECLEYHAANPSYYTLNTQSEVHVKYWEEKQWNTKDA